MSCRLMLLVSVLCCSGISTRVNAQQICVEFFDGQLIPARVFASSTSADVALVQWDQDRIVQDY